MRNLPILYICYSSKLTAQRAFVVTVVVILLLLLQRAVTAATDVERHREVSAQALVM